MKRKSPKQIREEKKALLQIFETHGKELEHFLAETLRAEVDQSILNDLRKLATKNET